MSNKFLYFAYGSNLLSQRIHINNPKAVRYGIGKLENYRLDFLTYSSRWKGASATIAPAKNSHVWGAIWDMDIEHLESLDKQEGVKDKIYFAHNVDVELPDGTKRNCRVYQQTNVPTAVKMTDLPSERRPSVIYLKTIILGAAESELPNEYQEFLKSIPHNGYTGKVHIELDLSIVN